MCENKHVFYICRDISSCQNKQRHVVRNLAKLRLPPYGFRGIGRGPERHNYLHQSIYFLLLEHTRYPLNCVHSTQLVIPTKSQFSYVFLRQERIFYWMSSETSFLLIFRALKNSMQDGFLGAERSLVIYVNLYILYSIGRFSSRPLHTSC